MSKPELVRVGTIGAPHGVSGRVKIQSFMQEPGAIEDLPFLSDASGERRFKLTITGEAGGTLVAQVEGIKDRTAAEGLRHVPLFTKAEHLPTPEDEDEFYYYELVDMAVVSPDGEALGRVVALHNFGAGDILEVALTNADGREQREMLAFSKANVPEIDRAKRVLVLVMPESIEVKP